MFDLQEENARTIYEQVCISRWWAELGVQKWANYVGAEMEWADYAGAEMAGRARWEEQTDHGGQRKQEELTISWRRK